MKIIYTICGEGIGHAARSKAVLDHIFADHEIQILAGHRAYTMRTCKGSPLSELHIGEIALHL